MISSEAAPCDSRVTFAEFFRHSSRIAALFRRGGLSTAAKSVNLLPQIRGREVLRALTIFQTSSSVPPSTSHVFTPAGIQRHGIDSVAYCCIVAQLRCIKVSATSSTNRTSFPLPSPYSLYQLAASQWSHSPFSPVATTSSLLPICSIPPLHHSPSRANTLRAQILRGLPRTPQTKASSSMSLSSKIQSVH